MALVIDVLRASTTICAALASGAKGLYPVGTRAGARALRGALMKEGTGEGIVLGGERGGVKIGGFDLDNSPASYSRAAVGGRTVVFTTTNGTGAALACQKAGAARIVFGCFANLSAVERVARESGLAVHLVCAGSDGAVALEDTIFAGVLVMRLLGKPVLGNAGKPLLGKAGNDWAELAMWAARSMGRTDQERATMAMARAAHAGRLAGLGFGGDLKTCAAVDSIGIVPELNLASGRIVVSGTG